MRLTLNQFWTFSTVLPKKWVCRKWDRTSMVPSRYNMLRAAAAYSLSPKKRGSTFREPHRDLHKACRGWLSSAPFKLSTDGWKTWCGLCRAIRRIARLTLFTAVRQLSANVGSSVVEWIRHWTPLLHVSSQWRRLASSLSPGATTLHMLQYQNCSS